jgi:hypothetical protein
MKSTAINTRLEIQGTAGVSPVTPLLQFSSHFIPKTKDLLP